MYSCWLGWPAGVLVRCLKRAGGCATGLCGGLVAVSVAARVAWLRARVRVRVCLLCGASGRCGSASIAARSRALLRGVGKRCPPLPVVV